jgi:hypothetical protein
MAHRITERKVESSRIAEAETSWCRKNNILLLMHNNGDREHYFSGVIAKVRTRFEAVGTLLKALFNKMRVWSWCLWTRWSSVNILYLTIFLMNLCSYPCKISKTKQQENREWAQCVWRKVGRIIFLCRCKFQPWILNLRAQSPYSKFSALNANL